MKITVQGKALEVPDGTTVTELLAIRKVDTPQFVTVSVNEEFLDPKEFPARVLAEGDAVEIIFFMGGGC